MLGATAATLRELFDLRPIVANECLLFRPIPALGLSFSGNRVGNPIEVLGPNKLNGAA